jgi:hypothetical protein
MHEVVNTGKTDLRIYEFQYGSIIEDSDVIKFNDPDAKPSITPEFSQRKKA